LEWFITVPENTAVGDQALASNMGESNTSTGSMPCLATQQVMAAPRLVLKRWKIMTAEGTTTLSAPLRSPATSMDPTTLSAKRRFL
jgi:hypothetical protein